MKHYGAHAKKVEKNGKKKEKMKKKKKNDRRELGETYLRPLRTYQDAQLPCARDGVLEGTIHFTGMDDTVTQGGM